MRMRTRTSNEDETPSHGLALDCGCRFIERDPKTIEWIYTCDPCMDALSRMTVVDRKILVKRRDGTTVFYPVREFYFAKE